MPLYLVTIHRPHGYDHAAPGNEAMMDDVSALNREMVAAGVRVFVGGLRPPETASSLVPQVDGEVSVTGGLTLEADTYADGLWVLDVADHDEALAWGRKAALACRGAVEVRAFY
jgi:hypothetical protein